MKQPASVLGRYSALAATIVVLFVIGAAVVSRILGNPDSFLDGLALAAFGVVAGTAGALTQLNGTVRRTDEQDALIAQQGALLAEQSRQLAELRERIHQGG